MHTHTCTLAIRPLTVMAALSFSLGAAAGQLPDLTIENVDDSGLVADGDSLDFSGVVIVTIRNLGGVGAGASTVLLFEDAVAHPNNTPGIFDPGLDSDLGTMPVSALAAGGTVDIAFVLADAPLLFRGSVLFAMADADSVVAEGSEANNVGATSDDCVGPGMLPTFEPVLAWHWNPLAVGYTGDPLYADWANVMVTPVVADVTGPAGVPDGMPDVIFPSTDNATSGHNFQGVLRVVDGQTGVEWYSISDPTLRILAVCSPAVGDIDGDGLPEIICGAFPSFGIRVFEHDGGWKLDSVETGVIHGLNALALANIDPPGVDPLPEIIARARVINRDGTTRWTGAVGAGESVHGYGIAYAVDVDADGIVEVVAGDTIYDASGQIVLSLTAPNHFSAVANFDDDPAAEFVLAGTGVVTLYDDDGSLIWQTAIPGGGGGPPTIADFDNDGAPDVGIAASVRYMAITGTGPQAGSILWERVIDDTTSKVTGSSVFDFEGDGAADVVYRDQTLLYLMDGATGADKAAPIPLSSCTWTEYVLVADVDADDHADIVAVANNNCGFGPQRGVYVYENVNDDWVNTRRVWNQHAYHITNVLDDLTIPEVASVNWLFPAAEPFNNFRQNLPSSGIDPLALADLTASYLRVTGSGAQGIGEVTVRIGNGGAAPANVATSAAIYDAGGAPGDPPLATVVVTQTIATGAFIDLAVALVPPIPHGTLLLAVIDAGNATFGDVMDAMADCELASAVDPLLPGSTVTECDECNNMVSSSEQDACAELDTAVLICESPSSFSWTFTFTNDSGTDASLLILPDPAIVPKVVFLNPPVTTGSNSGPITVTINGQVPGTQFCFDFVLADIEGNECCHLEPCITLPECVCSQVSDVQITATPTSGVYELSFTFTNLAAWNSQHVIFASSRSSFSPSIANIPPTPAYSTQSIGPITVTTASLPGEEECFVLGNHAADWITCCFIEPCVTWPDSPPVTGNQADLNGDGVVDGADPGIVLASWGAGGPADLDGDGLVDGGDLGLLLGAWGP